MVMTGTENDDSQQDRNISKNAWSVFEIIKDYFNQNGIAPTWTEIQAALGKNTGRGLDLALTSLEEAGLIKRIPKRHRGITIINSNSTNSNAETRTITIEANTSARNIAHIDIGDQLVIKDAHNPKEDTIYICSTRCRTDMFLAFKGIRKTEQQIVLIDDQGIEFQWPHGDIRIIGELEFIIKRVTPHAE